MVPCMTSSLDVHPTQTLWKDDKAYHTQSRTENLHHLNRDENVATATNLDMTDEHVWRVSILSLSQTHCGILSSLHTPQCTRTMYMLIHKRAYMAHTLPHHSFFYTLLNFHWDTVNYLYMLLVSAWYLTDSVRYLLRLIKPVWQNLILCMSLHGSVLNAILNALSKVYVN